MSVSRRLLWIIPSALLASWLALRTLAAVPAAELDDPQPPLASADATEVSDPALAGLIGRFADEARHR